MNEFWVEYPTTVEIITGRFMTALEAFRVLDFDVLAHIAWLEVGERNIPPGEIADAARTAASAAMDNIADQEVTLEQYAEVAFLAIVRTARAHGWKCHLTRVVLDDDIEPLPFAGVDPSQIPDTTGRKRRVLP
jgi:hypothetical protein